MSRWKEDREKIDRAYGDAIYDTWRSGRNPDLVEHENIQHNYYETYDVDEAAAMEVERLRKRSCPHD